MPAASRNFLFPTLPSTPSPIYRHTLSRAFCELFTLASAFDACIFVSPLLRLPFFPPFASNDITRPPSRIVFDQSRGTSGGGKVAPSKSRTREEGRPPLLPGATFPNLYTINENMIDIKQTFPMGYLAREAVRVDRYRICDLSRLSTPTFIQM